MTAMARLEPPYTRSMGNPNRAFRQQAVGSALPLWRSGRTSGRWHRPRSGVRIWSMFDPPEGRLCLHMWCGTSTSNADTAGRSWLGVLELPPHEPLCGTCEGRAIGAGYPPTGADPGVPLVFSPRSQYRPPAVCPAVRWGLVPDVDPRLALVRCPVCQDYMPVRAGGGPYNPTVNLERHPPGAGLIDPCLFHGWDQLVLDADNRPHCRCQPPEATP